MKARWYFLKVILLLISSETLEIGLKMCAPKMKQLSFSEYIQPKNPKEITVVSQYEV